jgi:hypothetical protein
VRIAQICRPLAESAVVVGLDFRNREKQHLEIGFTGVARFGVVPSRSTDDDDPRARNPSQSICADSAEAGGCSWAIARAPAVGVIVSLDTLDSILSKRSVISRSAADVCWDAATEITRRGARCCVCGWAGSLGVAREQMAASAQDREPVPAVPYSLDGAAVVRARAVDSRFPSEASGSSARSRLSVLPPGGLLGALGLSLAVLGDQDRDVECREDADWVAVGRIDNDQVVNAVLCHEFRGAGRG